MGWELIILSQCQVRSPMQIHTSSVTEVTPVQPQKTGCIGNESLEEKGDLIIQLPNK